MMTPSLTLIAMLTPPQFAEYGAILPMSILCAAAFLMILIDLFHTEETSREYLSYVSAFAFALSGLSCFILWDHTLDAPTFHGMLYLDRFALFFGALISVAGVMTSLFAPAYLRSIRMDRSEFYHLTLFSGAGMIGLVASSDLLSIFLSLEVMSIPLYCIAALIREDRRSAEAGLKYFVLGAFSTALTLYGIALIYGMTGTTNLEALAVVIEQMSAATDRAAFDASHTILALGAFLVLSGFLFKVAAAPFHVWTPDVYTGSPTPSTGFMATGVKAASFAVLLRLVIIGFHSQDLIGGFFGMGWIDAFFVFSAASILVGNLAAIAQTNVKRMLAYSSIAHAGYILIGFVAANSRPEYYLLNDTVLFYLMAYTFTTLGAFGVLSYVSRTSGRPVETYDDLRGAGLRYPIVGLLMAIFMFSSAGIPPTAGFLGKFYIFRAAVEVGAATGEYSFIGVTILAVLASIAGIYYYLKVLVVMYMSESEASVNVTGTQAALLGLIVCAVLVVWNGVMPQHMIDASQQGILDMEGTPHLRTQIAEGNKALLERKQASSLRMEDQLLSATQDNSAESFPLEAKAPSIVPAPQVHKPQVLEPQRAAPNPSIPAIDDNRVFRLADDEVRDLLQRQFDQRQQMEPLHIR